MIIRFDIFLPLLIEEERVSKLLLMFQNMILKIRGVPMHSTLEDQSRMMLMNDGKFLYLSL